jgi:hypothetical protein
VADELTRRLISLFEPNNSGERPLHGSYNKFYKQPENADLVLFYEYFHGESGQ